jgi:peptide/nickel transport system substrate-binding protein
MPHSPRRLRRLALAAPLLAACSGGGDSPSADRGGEGAVGGTLVWAVPGKTGNLLPPRLRDIQSKQVTDLVYERLAEIGPELNVVGDAGFTPRLARRWTWSADSLALTFELDPAARWHDGRPVRAEDVRFTFALNKDPEVGSTEQAYLTAIDSVTAPDSLTATVWFARRYPEQFHDAAARVSILPAHLLADAAPDALGEHPLNSAPMGSGPYRFVRLEPGVLLEMAADTGYHLGRPKLDRIVMAFVDPNAAVNQLLAGEVDVYEALRAENMPQLAQATHLVANVGPGALYGFFQFNLADPSDTTRPHPIFGDRRMRHALSMLIDRQAIVQTSMDTLGVVGQGPLPRAVFAFDASASELGFDRTRATALLDSLGWRDADGDGVRERDGRPLAFKILVPSTSETRKRFALLLQQQLAPAGVRADIDIMEGQAVGERMVQGRFDATLNAWQLTDGSPSGLRNTWSTRGPDGRGKQNYGYYANAAFDAQVDSLLATYDTAARREHLTRAFQIIEEDAPAVWLYEPKNAIGVHRRFVTPPLRAAGWWLDLPQWSVRPGEELPRDRAAGTTVAQR